MADPRGTTTLLFVLLLLAFGTALCGVAVVRRSWLRVPAVALASSGTTAWLLVNGRFEGPVLYAFSSDHGVTLSDALVLPAGVLMAVMLLQAFRER